MFLNLNLSIVCRAPCDRIKSLAFLYKNEVLSSIPPGRMFLRNRLIPLQVVSIPQPEKMALCEKLKITMLYK